MPQALKITLIAGALIAACAAYFYLQIDWEARALRKQLDSLTRLVEKDGPVSTFEALSRSRRLADFFATPASVEYFPGRKLPEDLDAISAGFLSAWGQIQEASITVLRHETDIRQDQGEARSRVTIRGRVIAGGRDQMRDTLDYQIFWQKLDGDWRIRRMLPVE
jgi:hypothetical protein